MKKFLIPTMALMLAMSASAETYPYLSFQTVDGSVVSLKSSNLNLTIEDGKLVVQNDEGSNKFVLTDLARMFFSQSTETAITNLNTDVNSTLQVYTTSGVFLGGFDSEHSLRRSVPSGIYVVKTNGKTLKMAVK
ncbi:hypothetical protein [Leyella stercorea]|uniref:hypothetical protein n=1 Tax=Leyella stercorea TaxID=363265 RepID=UPI00242BC6DD|nr:hypothetical protein [Leyella stercorea]